jgi:hypothetical protein
MCSELAELMAEIEKQTPGIVWVSRLPDDVYFFYTTDEDFYPRYIDQGDYDTLAACEQAALDYALNHGCRLWLYDDADGCLGEALIQQAMKREERQLELELR